MSEEKIKEIFSRNLTLYLSERGKTQADLSRHMNVSTATVSDWCNGKKLPRLDKIQSICNWLMIEKSDLLEEKEKKATQKTIFEQQNMIKISDEARDFALRYDKLPPELRTTIQNLLKYSEQHP